MDRIEGNIWRYQIFSVVSFTPIMIPVIVLFWQENGLDLLDIFLLQGIFAVSMVILEVPTGMVADRLGKRTSLVASMTIMCSGIIVYALGRSFLIFLIAEIVLALGISLLSGADSALLYDTLKHLDRAEEYQQLEGKTRAIQMVSFAISSLLGGLIGTLSYRATVWITGIGPFFGLLIAIGFIEVNKPSPTQTFRTALSSYRELISQSLRFVSRHQLVRWLIIFTSIISGSVSWLLWLYQPYMEWSGLPVWGFGIAFAIFNLFAAVMSHLAYKLEMRIGRSGIIILLIILLLAPLILMSFIVFPLSFLFILGHQAIRGIIRPVVSDWILRYTYADKRATVLSISALGSRLFFALTSPLIGLVAKQTTMAKTLLFQAAFLTIVLSIVLIFYFRIPEKYFQIKKSVAEHH